mgnify:CR=1 FL=1
MAKKKPTTAHVSGYVGKVDGKLALTTFDNKLMGYGHQVSCSRIRPGQPGSWISDKRCSYRFKVGGAGGKWFAGRGYGEGMSINLRQMKHPPKM